MEEYVQMPSGIFVLEHEAEAIVRKYRRPKGVDLFCGAGGMSLGAYQAGFDIVAAVDNVVYSARTYLYNLGAYPLNMVFIEESDSERFEKSLRTDFKKTGVKFGKNGEIKPGGNGIALVDFCRSGGNAQNVLPAGAAPVPNFFFGDVRKLNGADILKAAGLEVGELDCVFGGPPCQGYSTSGKQNVMDPRNSLVFDFARLVIEMQPKTMVFENVPGILQMVTPEGVPVVEALSRILEDGDFGAYNSFLKSIDVQSGNFGLLRGKRKKKKRPSQRETDAPRQQEMELAEARSG